MKGFREIKYCTIKYWSVPVPEKLLHQLNLVSSISWASVLYTAQRIQEWPKQTGPYILWASYPVERGQNQYSSQSWQVLKKKQITVSFPIPNEPSAWLIGEVEQTLISEMRWTTSAAEDHQQMWLKDVNVRWGCDLKWQRVEHSWLRSGRQLG